MSQKSCKSIQINNKCWRWKSVNLLSQKSCRSIQINMEVWKIVLEKMLWSHIGDIEKNRKDQFYILQSYWIDSWLMWKNKSFLMGCLMWTVDLEKSKRQDLVIYLQTLVNSVTSGPLEVNPKMSDSKMYIVPWCKCLKNHFEHVKNHCYWYQLKFLIWLIFDKPFVNFCFIVQNYVLIMFRIILIC